jgi:hypothetical protein
MALRSNRGWTFDIVPDLSDGPHDTRDTVNLVNFPLGGVLRMVTLKASNASRRLRNNLALSIA